MHDKHGTNKSVKMEPMELLAESGHTAVIGGVAIREKYSMNRPT